MNEFIEENKKKLVIIGILIVIIVLFTIINNIVGEDRDIVNPEESIRTMASTYYEELYYPYLKKNHNDYYEDFLAKYTQEGLKVELSKMIQSIGDVPSDSLIGEKGKGVDILSTYVIFYPSLPYTEKDYRMELKIAYYKGFVSGKGEKNE